jgi:3-oxoadipate enol-lactonase
MGTGGAAGWHQARVAGMTVERWLEVEPDIQLHVAIDDFTDPWRPAETVLMVHSMGQNLEAWRGWVPHLARDFRVVRFDVRGFGKSTPIAETATWSIERLHDDIEAVMDFIDCPDAHFVGSQSGGSVALTLAARRPARVQSVVAVAPMITGTPDVSRWLEQIESEGVLAWARSTMAGRLGSSASAAQVDYWAGHIQGKTPLSTLRSYLPWVPSVDIRPELDQIKCRTQIVTTTGSHLRPLDGVKAYQEKIPNSELVVIKGDAWHPAGAYPDICAPAACRFFQAKLR